MESDVMNDDRGNGHDPLERNVEQLLSRVEPELKMPDGDKSRVLAALRAEAPASPTVDRKERTIGTRKGWTWASVAAAIVVLALIVLWPGGPQQTIAWAEVARHFEQGRSFTAWATIVEIAPSGEKNTTWLRVYQKDPGFTRSELLTAEAGQAGPEGTIDPSAVAAFTITKSERERSAITRVHPKDKMIHRTTLTFAGTELESRAVRPDNLVATTWDRLSAVTADETRRIGEREIDGQPAIGFEADIRELADDPSAPPAEGVARIWAHRENAAPLEVELEISGPGGYAFHTTYGRLEWDVDLPDELFEEPRAEGWTVQEERMHKVGFTRTRLADGVSLTIGPRGGSPVITEADIEAVLHGISSWVTGQEEPRVALFARTTPDAEPELRSFTTAHRGERLLVCLNDEFEYEITVGGPIGRELQLDITRLGKTLEEFEQDYLTD
jgi:hypothetical protein